MTGCCDGCGKLTNTLKYENYCSKKCFIDFMEWEYGSMTHNPDSNCHCQTCTTMNEPLTLEGDIRYLKEHIITKDRQLVEKDLAIANAETSLGVYRTMIETKDRQLADANLQVVIYKKAWLAVANESNKLREDAKKNRARITELEDTVMRLGEDNRLLREEKLKPSLVGNLGLQQENERLKVELEASRGQIRNQLGIILDLRKEKETLVNDHASLVEEVNELYKKLDRIATIVDEIVNR